MKKILPLLLLLSAALIGCHRKDGMTAEPATLSVSLDTVRATQVKFSIASPNSEAYYFWAVKPDSIMHRFANEKEIADDLIDDANLLYKFITAIAQEYGYTEEIDYNETCLYHGSHSYNRAELSPNEDYRLLVIGVHPQTHTAMGALQQLAFHTAPIDSADVSFDIRFAGDTLVITPSDNTVTYLWDYESEEDIAESFYTEDLYIKNVVAMYEEYGFVSDRLKQGEVRYAFGSDPAMQEGAEYVLFVVGYNGEMNTEMHSQHFVYHKGAIHRAINKQINNSNEKDFYLQRAAMRCRADRVHVEGRLKTRRKQL